MMPSDLNHLLAQEKIADLTRAAERTRYNRGGRPTEPAAPRGRVLTRVRARISRRLRLGAGAGAAATSSCEPCHQAASPPGLG